MIDIFASGNRNHNEVIQNDDRKLKWKCANFYICEFEIFRKISTENSRKMATPYIFILLRNTKST